MTKKELKRLSRVELIEMLILQTRRVERLQAELDVANAELARRQKAYDESGDLAEAALKLSGVFEAAQRAAELYLNGVRQKAEGEEPNGETSRH